MENYYYLNEELTGYDKYILSKKHAKAESMPTFELEKPTRHSKTKPEKPPTSFAKTAENRQYSDYDKYLFGQLCRTEPSAEKVLTKQEFYNTNVEEEQTKSNSLGKLFANITFKKGGKIILVFYVIIMVVLASILIVANTSDIYKSDIANATQTRMVENNGTVRSMTIEDNDSEQDNWFDRLCDAINK